MLLFTVSSARIAAFGSRVGNKELVRAGVKARLERGKEKFGSGTRKTVFGRRSFTSGTSSIASLAFVIKGRCEFSIRAGCGARVTVFKEGGAAGKACSSGRAFKAVCTTRFTFFVSGVTEESIRAEGGAFS